MIVKMNFYKLLNLAIYFGIPFFLGKNNEKAKLPAFSKGDSS